jgi:hypothetical protein
MHDDWLVAVFREIEAYAIEEGCVGLLPLIDHVYAAAVKELDPSAVRALTGATTNPRPLIETKHSTSTLDLYQSKDIQKSEYSS